MFVPRYTEQELREVVARSTSLSRGAPPFRAAHRGRELPAAPPLARGVGHLDRPLHARVGRCRRASGRRSRTILVEHSTYSRGQLKRRLYDEGLEAAAMRALRPGRGLARQTHGADPRPRQRRRRTTTASRTCASSVRTAPRRSTRIAVARTGISARAARRAFTAAAPFRAEAPRPAVLLATRAARAATASPATASRSGECERPPYEQLVAEVAATGWSAVGRKYGVSDNAVRKWVRAYERERAASGGEAGPA